MDLIIAHILEFIGRDHRLYNVCRLWRNAIDINNKAILEGLYRKYPDRVGICDIHISCTSPYDIAYASLLHNDGEAVRLLTQVYVGYLPIQWDILLSAVEYRISERVANILLLCSASSPILEHPWRVTLISDIYKEYTPTHIEGLMQEQSYYCLVKYLSSTYRLHVLDPYMNPMGQSRVITACKYLLQNLYTSYFGLDEVPNLRYLITWMNKHKITTSPHMILSTLIEDDIEQLNTVLDSYIDHQIYGLKEYRETDSIPPSTILGRVCMVLGCPRIFKKYIMPSILSSDVHIYSKYHHSITESILLDTEMNENDKHIVLGKLLDAISSSLLSTFEHPYILENNMLREKFLHRLITADHKGLREKYGV